jgi:predicted Zn-dependent peptidase
MGLPLFKKDHPDYHVMQLLNTLLGGYFGSRLMRNIREEKGLTYGISSGLATLEEGGYLVIGTEVKKEFTQVVLDEIYKEVDALCHKQVGTVELETVKSYLAGKLLKSMNTPFALAGKFKNIYLDGLTYDFYRNYLKALEKTTPQQVRAVANRYLVTDQWHEIVVGEFA